MNLKEAYRYSNFLESMMNNVEVYLRTRAFTTTTKQHHMRSKVNPDAQDEIVEVPKAYDVEFTANDVIDFAVKIIDERERLFDAISKAKSTTEINIDNAISMNRQKQNFATLLSGIVNMKSSEEIKTGRSYKFDVNGEQKPYVYDIAETTTIDFNRIDVKNLIKKLSTETDKISTKLDEINITTQVDFTPLFDVNDTFEDLVAK